jgi:hypothetical protein
MTDGGGMYLLVTPAGGKLWRWKYRHAGAQKEMSFGKWPDVPLPLARDRHAAARKLLASGTDPMAQRKADKAAQACLEGSEGSRCILFEGLDVLTKPIEDLCKAEFLPAY